MLRINTLEQNINENRQQAADGGQTQTIDRLLRSLDDERRRTGDQQQKYETKIGILHKEIEGLIAKQHRIEHSIGENPSFKKLVELEQVMESVYLLNDKDKSASKGKPKLQDLFEAVKTNIQEIKKFCENESQQDIEARVQNENRLAAVL